MIRIRPASFVDIPVIRSIAHATWPISYREMISSAQIAYMLDLMYCEGSLHEQMTAKRHRFLLAYVNEEAIGFAGFEHGYQVGRTRLHKLYVLPSSQGIGAGNLLLTHVERAAVSTRDTTLELNVNRFNPTRQWYAKRGFVIERDEVIDIGQGFVMDDHVMVKVLATGSTGADLERPKLEQPTGHG